MTKEEKIKEAYGEYWEQLTDSAKFSALNNNGWLHYNNIVNEKGTLLDALDMDFLSDIDVFRPKSLQGIENNNGWFRIESEADLPKDEDELYHLTHINKDRFLPSESLHNLEKFWRSGTITHYQPTERTKPPIY